MTQNRNRTNIVLIGMSGVGKTTIGEYISNKTNMKFFDSDDIIVSNNHMSIDDIFDEYGEEYFRSLEKSIIEDISKHNRVIVSTGGGVVLDKGNIDNLKANGIIFLLNSSIDNIFNNIKPSYLSDDKRPLLKNSSDLKSRIKYLFGTREELYISSADYIIGVDDKSISAIGDEIIYIFNNIYSCS